MKDELQIFQSYLSKKNIDSELKSVLPDCNFNCVEFTSLNGWISKVYNGSLLILNNQIRAYQEERSNEFNKDQFEYSLIILNGSEQEFKWDLVKISQYDNSFNCIYLGEHNDSIIHIHKHELNTTILSYRDQIIKRFHCKSELINRNGDIISLELVQKSNRDKPVELIKLPNLNKLEPISLKRAEELNLKPIGNYPLGFLNNK